MKKFDYATAINQLGLDKRTPINVINMSKVPKWVSGKDFFELFLPYLKIIGDSREQDLWIMNACEFYGISFELAKKDKKIGGENLKEGDYTFKVCFGEKEFDFTGIVAYERKGSLSELYNNCTGYNKETKKNDRERIEREFVRFVDKKYNKVVLLLQFGEKLTDLIDMEFSYRGERGLIETKNVGYTIYSTLMSWKQPNNKNFQIIQSSSHLRLFWLFVQDIYYYFRNHIRLECLEKGLIKEAEK